MSYLFQATVALHDAEKLFTLAESTGERHPGITAEALGEVITLVRMVSLRAMAMCGFVD